MIKAIRSYETPPHTRATRHHIEEDDILQRHPPELFRSFKTTVFILLTSAFTFHPVFVSVMPEYKYVNHEIYL
jgi:hypothetical protein